MGTLELWQRLSSMPAGKWIFARLVCSKAPYFGSIRPRFEELRPDYAEVRVSKRRSILNHLGTVHAIAMCNMAELAAGTMTEVTVPPTHRWIPKGMAVEYLKKATTDLVAIATPESSADWSVAGEYIVKVIVRDKQAEPVFQALITMWVSPRKVPARSGMDRADAGQLA
jgi:acyl-coenzyme A thioesterase PaaI-like protein